MTKQNNSSIDIPSFIDLFLRASEAKKIERKGWEMHGIKQPETVAEHTFSLSLLTLQLAPLLSNHIEFPLDVQKLIQMSILHDLGEIEAGDIIVSQGENVDIERKLKKEIMEKKGIKKLFQATDKSNYSVDLFDEILEKTSVEANIFWQLDNLDTAIQALNYEIAEKKDLSELFEKAKSHIMDELLVEFFEEIVSRRPKNK